MINIYPTLSIRILLVVIVFAHTSAEAQVYGCTDPLANNYNPSATVNNGSCTYNITSYTPPLKVDPISDSLVETSGLQMAGNFLWSFNDGGGKAAIYRIDTLSNAVLQSVYLEGATNVDWEDIAFDGTNLYIGDFGNNANGARTNLKIYKFPFASIPSYENNPVVVIPSGKIEVIKFSYNDQPQPPQPQSANSTAYDCEAMLVDSGKIHLFTKNWLALNTTHYVINSISAGTYKAMPVDTLATNFLVTAADKAPNQKLIVLLGYQASGVGDHFLYLLTDYNGINYFSGNKRRLDLPNVTVMGQAEGISLRTDGYGYISNERFTKKTNLFTLTVAQKLHSFDISDYVALPGISYFFMGNGDWELAANWSNNTMPASPLKKGSKIIINPAEGGKCVLNSNYVIETGASIVVKQGKQFIIKGKVEQH